MKSRGRVTAGEQGVRREAAESLLCSGNLRDAAEEILGAGEASRGASGEGSGAEGIQGCTSRTNSDWEVSAVAEEVGRHSTAVQEVLGTHWALGGS